MSLQGILAILGGWTVLVAGGSAWLSRLVTERLLSTWRAREQAALEHVKDSLATNRALLEQGAASLAAAHSPLAQRRLAAVERVWLAVLGLRTAFELPVFFYSVVLPSEYNRSLREGGRPASAIPQLTDSQIVAAIRASSSVEEERPQIGELLWWQFYMYRAFLGRLATLLLQGQQEGAVHDWRDDKHIRDIVASLLPPEVVHQVSEEARSLVSVRLVVDTIEALILREIRIVASGQVASVESLRNAKALHELAASLEQVSPHRLQQGR